MAPFVDRSISPSAPNKIHFVSQLQRAKISLRYAILLVGSFLASALVAATRLWHIPPSPDGLGPKWIVANNDVDQRVAYHNHFNFRVPILRELMKICSHCALVSLKVKRNRKGLWFQKKKKRDSKPFEIRTEPEFFHCYYGIPLCIHNMC